MSMNGLVRGALKRPYWRITIIGFAMSVAALLLRERGEFPDLIGASRAARLAFLPLLVTVPYALEDPFIEAGCATRTRGRTMKLAFVAPSLVLVAVFLLSAVLLPGGRILLNARGMASGLLLEGSTLTALGIGVAALVPSRLGRAVPGLLGAASQMALFAFAWMLPVPWRLFRDSPLDPSWEAIHRVWAALLVGSVVLFHFASRDRYRCRSRR